MKTVFYTDVSVLNDDAIFCASYQKLPSFRQEKADKLKLRPDKNLSVGAWLLLERALAHAGFNTCKLEFDAEKSGKPYIRQGSNNSLYFSLSHSGNIALAAISDVPIGADIERIGNFNPDICRRFFTRKECDAIMRQNHEESQKDMFFRIWTLKESYVKMTGKGISGFSQCEIVPNKILTDRSEFSDCFFDELFIPGYKAAVCSKSEEKPKTEAFELINIFS